MSGVTVLKPGRMPTAWARFHTACCHARFAAPRDGPLEALEIRAVRQRGRCSLRCLHDAARTCSGECGRALRHLAQLGSPHRDHGLVALECAVADEQAEQVAFGLAALAIPAAERAVIVQDDLVTRTQLRAGVHSASIA